MLETCRKNNVGLNSEKLQFKQEKINFYGHTLTEKGIQPAEPKLQAIKNIKVPANAAELHTILGMVNYLNRFSVKLAEYTAPAVGAHIASHVCRCSFQGLHDTLSDHRLQIVVLDTLHLVAPLFVRHLSLARCHVATKGAYLWGADSQTQC